MVKDERSLRTRQRPVRSGALRGAKSEIFCTRPRFPRRQPPGWPSDRQPDDFPPLVRKNEDEKHDESPPSP